MRNHSINNAASHLEMKSQAVDGNARVNIAVLIRVRGYMMVNLLVIIGSSQQRGSWMLMGRWKGIGSCVPMEWIGEWGIHLLCAGFDEPTYFRYPDEAGKKPMVDP